MYYSILFKKITCCHNTTVIFKLDNNALYIFCLRGRRREKIFIDSKILYSVAFKTANHPKPPETTRNHPQPLETTRNYQNLSTRNHQQSPRTIWYHPKPHITSQNLNKTSCNWSETIHIHLKTTRYYQPNETLIPQKLEKHNIYTNSRWIQFMSALLLSFIYPS